MQIYPAIDIEGGVVARGLAGPSADPLTEAHALLDAGATWLHVVDMDRVFGTGENAAAIRRIAAIDGAQVQLGGGYTQSARVTEALAWGVRRVIVGVGLLPDLAPLASDVGADGLGVNVDVRDGALVSRTGPASAPGRVAEVIDRTVGAGVTTVVYRDLDRDGTLDGADHEGAERLVGRGAEIILAGGIATVAEISRARRVPLAGVIVGRALHERRFTLGEALACSA